MVALFVLWAFGVFNTSNEEYTNCIDYCVYGIEYCPSYEYGKDLRKWISESDYDSCVNELESCVSRCKLDYGK